MGSFLAALLGTAHHTIHVALISLGLATGASLLGGPTRAVLLALSAVSSIALSAWILRARNMPAARFWGLAVSVILSAALLSYSVTLDGF